MLFHLNNILTDLCRCSHLSLCTNCTTTAYVYYANWCYTVTQIIAYKIAINTCSLILMKYQINFIVAMGCEAGIVLILLITCISSYIH